MKRKSRSAVTERKPASRHATVPAALQTSRHADALRAVLCGCVSSAHAPEIIYIIRGIYPRKPKPKANTEWKPENTLQLRASPSGSRRGLWGPPTALGQCCSAGHPAPHTAHSPHSRLRQCATRARNYPRPHWMRMALHPDQHHHHQARCWQHSRVLLLAATLRVGRQAAH